MHVTLHMRWRTVCGFNTKTLVVIQHAVQAVENSALEDLFTRVSPGTLYAKVTSSGKPADKAEEETEDLEYYL